jgi:hypothetical protein
MPRGIPMREVASSMKLVRRLLELALVCTLMCAGVPLAAENQSPPPQRPAYTLERYDEDWSFLQDASKRTGLFDPIKWIPLGKRESWFLTLGGDSTGARMAMGALCRCAEASGFSPPKSEPGQSRRISDVGTTSV